MSRSAHWHVLHLEPLDAVWLPLPKSAPVRQNSRTAMASRDISQACLVSRRHCEYILSNNKRVLIFSVYLSFTKVLQTGHHQVLTLAQLDMALSSISGLITLRRLFVLEAVLEVAHNPLHNPSSYSTRTPLNFPLLSLCPHSIKQLALPQITFPRYSVSPQPNTRG